MSVTSRPPRLGVILLDFDGYSAQELRASPTDPAGLGVQPVGFLDHPGSWGCDTVFVVAEGCGPDESAVASDSAGRGLKEAARGLDGRVDLITTYCAYTSYADQAFDGITTPVVPGSLALLAFARTFGDVAILASSRATLLGLMGQPPPAVRVIGLEAKPEWGRYQTFTFDMEPLDRAAMAHEVIEALEEDYAANGPPAALVLECTGLPQFRSVVGTVFHGPIVDISSVVHQLLGVTQPAAAQFRFDDHRLSGPLRPH